MNTTIRTTARTLTLTGALAASLFTATTMAQTPEAAGCAGVSTPAAGAMGGMDMGTPGAMGGMDMGTPGAMDMDMEVEFDQMYIDMMIGHHGGIIGLAEVAQAEVQDPRLQEIARTIIDVQSAEQEELSGLRAEWYGSPEPAPMDDMMMSMMMEAMPGMGTADEMMMQMDPAQQVQAFCAAEDKDLAFIDMTIAHHQMAITSSEAALEQAVHPEITAFAERVIADQQAEIDELEAIRAELTGEATPAS